MTSFSTIAVSSMAMSVDVVATARFRIAVGLTATLVLGAVRVACRGGSREPEAVSERSPDDV